MKIIHCADVHLDSALSANLTGKQRKQRKSEVTQTFLRMIDYAQEQDVRAIIIAGDLFDSRHVTKTTQNLLLDAVQRHPKITFFYLRGNHDEASELADDMPENWKVFGDSWTSYTLEEENVQIVITGAQMNADNSARLHQSLVLDNRAINIVTMHGQEVGYVGKDKTECVQLQALKDKGIDYLALGHIHAYKRERLDSRGSYVYCGCLDPRGFDECGEHGFVLLDIDVNRRAITDTFIPFASRLYYELAVDISGCETTPQVQSCIEKALQERNISSDSLVKLVLCGQVSVDGERNPEWLCEQFESRFFFLKIKDETKLAVDYAAFALDASLKGEFVRTVQADTTLDEEMKLQIIRMGILALAGEEFV